MTSRGRLTRFASVACRNDATFGIARRAKYMFSKGLPLNVLPTEARQSFTHHVDHRLGGPAVTTIVKEGEGEDLTIDRGDVARQPDHFVGGAGLGVEISLGGGIPHPTPEELGGARGPKGGVQPPNPPSPGRIDQ